MVIAASGDGILISDKERSGYMKPFVEKIGGDVHYAEKSWGTYTVIDVQPGSMTIKITLRAGSQMKYHSHELRDEIWTVISGTGKTIVDGMEQVIHPGDVVSVAAGCKHTLVAETNMSLIEIQIGEEISHKDKSIFLCPNTTVK